MAIDVNENNFEEETKQGVVLVDFYAPWCGPCRMLTPVLDQLENVKVVKVNVDENKNLAVKHNVTSIPKLILMKDGVSHGDYLGLQRKEFLQEKINEANSE